jgi:hypothetical protein
MAAQRANVIAGNTMADVREIIGFVCDAAWCACPGESQNRLAAPRL